MDSLLPGVSLPSLQQKKKISIANPKIRNVNKELLYFLLIEEFSIQNETCLAYCSLSICMHQESGNLTGFLIHTEFPMVIVFPSSSVSFGHQLLYEDTRNFF